MNEIEKIKTISAKIENLLHAVEHSGGNFTVIDKDMLSAYIRDLYEQVVAINTSQLIEKLPVAKVVAEEVSGQIIQPRIKETEKTVEAIPVEEPVVIAKEEKLVVSISPKKSITEIYADKNENAKTVNEKFKKAGTEVADRLKQIPIADLKAYIGLNKRFAFINQLFNGDEVQYETAIAKVNSFKTYEEAADYIRSSVLQNFKWDDDEPLVAEFFTLVMRRYLN